MPRARKRMPSEPLQQVMSTTNGDYRQITENINYSPEQVPKIILIMQPTVDVENCDSVSNKCEHRSEKVYKE